MPKINYLLSLLFVATIMSGCGDDDDDDNDSGPTFTNQVLQGKINAQDWIAASSTARNSSFEEGMLSIEIGGAEVSDVCDEFFLEGLRVIFSVPNEVGVYELNFGTQSITLFDPEETLNIIIVDGTIEIESIDATEGGSVTGRIVGESDDDNFVDGNFVASYCPE